MSREALGELYSLSTLRSHQGVQSSAPSLLPDPTKRRRALLPLYSQIPPRGAEIYSLSTPRSHQEVQSSTPSLLSDPTKRCAELYSLSTLRSHQEVQSSTPSLISGPTKRCRALLPLYSQIPPRGAELYSLSTLRSHHEVQSWNWQELPQSWRTQQSQAAHQNSYQKQTYYLTAQLQHCM